MLKKDKSCYSVYLKAFLLGLLTSFCFFLPYLVVDKGFFLYAGDFNSQQIPFYMYMNGAVKSGNLSWGWPIDLGSSVVNSYSFYLLGSPFFWLSCLFPPRRVPYLLPYLLMLKFRVGNLGAFGYLRRYAKNDNYAMLGAVLYTFSGFSIYNIFFNHFIESVVFFPYLLWALDSYVYDGKKSLFPIAVAVNFLNNYFFFIGQVIFLFIYFFVKVFTKEYRITKKQFLGLAFESVLGCFMGILLFCPSLASILKNPRISHTLKGFGIWLYGNVQQYFAIAASRLLPPDPPYIPSLFTQGAIKWTSMSAFVAFGGLFGLFRMGKHNRKSSFFKIFIICAVCAFVPVLNSGFYAFNSSYYARWYYMPVLMLAAMNMQVFSWDSEKIISALKTTALVTAVLLIFGITPVEKDDGGLFIGLADQVAIYWVQILIAFLSLYLAYLVVKIYRKNPDYSRKLMVGALSVIMIFSVIHLGLTKMPQWDADKLYRPQNYDNPETFDFLRDEEKNFRLDAFNCYENMGLFNDLPFLQFFNSTVSPSIMEFYPEVGVKRDVSSKPDFSIYALRSLLSVKYAVAPNWEEENFGKETGYRGWKVIQKRYPFTVYENMNFIPIGFAYDKYVDYRDLEEVARVNRSNVLMRAIAMDEETLKKYDLPLEKLTVDEMFDFTYESYLSDLSGRRQMACSEFNMTPDGFKARIDLKKDNLVFFSVPYDEGFTATVNGKKTEIEKVDYGLSAVFRPRGKSEIIFTYKTPYLGLGIGLTAAAWAVWAVYVFVVNRKKKVKQ